MDKKEDACCDACAAGHECEEPVSCLVVGKLADNGLATIEEATSCLITDPDQDEALHKRLFARAMARALTSARVTGVTTMVAALASGIHPLRDRKSLDGLSGSELAVVLAKALDADDLDDIDWDAVPTLAEAQDELDARDAPKRAKAKAEARAAFEASRSWQTAAIDGVLEITNQRVAAGEMTEGWAAMLNMLHLQAVTESTSIEEAGRRFALKVEAVRQKAQTERDFEQLQETIRVNHALASQAHARGELEEVRIGGHGQVLNPPLDRDLERERERQEQDRAERERQAAVIADVKERWKREPHPRVLGLPQS